MAIQDFGEKIGGAKKDLWKLRGLMVDDLLDMNDAEKEKFIKKDNIWKKPDYEALVAEGIPVRVVYFMKLMRDSIPTKPSFSVFDDEERISDKQEGYISFVSSFRDVVMELSKESELPSFYNNHIAPYLENPKSRFVTLKPEAYDCITNKTLKSSLLAEKTFRYIDEDIKKKQFCYSEEQKILAPYEFLEFKKEKFVFTKDFRDHDVIEMKVFGGTRYFYPSKKEYMEPDSWKDGSIFILRGNSFHSRNYESIEAAKASILSIFNKVNEKDASKNNGPSTEKTNRKGKLVPKQLKHIRRIGIDYRKGSSINGQNYLDTFGFKGGEFGNYMTEKDRQASLDFGFEALYDLAQALEIEPTDISLGGRLSIAFGARGSGSALAHYEPLREVINLTKMRGAGSLAHEWGHAMDDIFGKEAGYKGFLTENRRSKDISEVFMKLINSMQYKKISNEETLLKQKNAVSNQMKRLENQINSYFPSTLSEEQIQKKNKLIQALFEHAKNNEQFFGSYSFTQQTNPYIEAISDYRKELTNRVIPKDGRRDINFDYDRLCSRFKDVGSEMLVKTDFYENSCIIDKNYSKTSHGYWQSTVEMFARAFACYIRDKLDEKGVRSDYLCGHSEDATAFISDRDGNLKEICAIPQGEERIILNELFDELISEFKEKGLLHHKDYKPEIHNEKPMPEKKPSLDSIIRTASEGSENRKTEALNLRETKNGQLELIF